MAFQWGTIGMTSLDEPRANFHGHMGVDAVSGRIQPQYPRWKTNVKVIFFNYCIIKKFSTRGKNRKLGSNVLKENKLSECTKQHKDYKELIGLVKKKYFLKLIFYYSPFCRKVNKNHFTIIKYVKREHK